MKAFLRTLSIICLVAWMGLIFYFSHQTAAESSAVSGSVIELIAQKFYPDFDVLSQLERQELISSLQYIVRSVAHYCIYGGLGFFAYLTFVSYVKLKYKTRVFWMLFVSLLYAVGDEIHQNFIEGRSFQLIDIGVDFGGALTAVLLCSLFVVIISPLRRRVRYVDSQSNPLELDIKYEEYDFPVDEHQEDNYINEVYQEKIMVDNLNDKNDKIDSEGPLEETPQKTVISEEFEYAASIIGKTVVEATRVCNELTAQNSDDKKELVNLALGRTEVLKAEILKILSSEATFQEKKDLMQKEQEAAYDYFDSIKAQIG